MVELVQKSDRRESKPGFLALVDLSYEYDPGGNIATIDDGVRQETRKYQYDFLDRLTFAGVRLVPTLLRGNARGDAPHRERPAEG